MDIAAKAQEIIRLALGEDLGAEGDITTEATCPAGAKGRATIVSRGACRVAGGPVAARVFELAGEGAAYRALLSDGATSKPGQAIGRVDGELATILSGERTALNFLGRMCGVATLTSRLVDVARPHGVLILDTRKTGPGMRALDKYAVAMGGGTNHREGLFDGIIIKDNHIAAAGGIAIAVRRVRERYGDRYPVEVEAATMEEVREALRSGADTIMLDNMGPEMVKDAVAIVDGRARTEVSGGVNPENLASYVELGIDAISLGFLTHSAPAADLSLELEVG